MAFPHHIGYRTGARGVNWDSFREALSPVVELVSMHGCAETSLTDRPFLHSMGPCEGANTIHSGWSLGLIFGVIGNTDHHSGHPGSYGHGRGAVYATANDRNAIWDAIRERRTNALTGDNVHLFARLGDTCQGGIVTPRRAAVLEVEAVGGSFIDCIDVLRNGRVTHRVTPAITPAPVDAGDGRCETIVVLELGWGARGTHHDWRGRLRVRGGELLAVEPRLRGPEVVSPLEGEGADPFENAVERQDDAVDFAVRARANPNNATPAMQAIAARVTLGPEAEIVVETDGRTVAVPAERLFRGAVTANLGPIDSPAFRLHPLPRPEDWQWQGRIELGDLAAGDWVALRLRQSNRQWAWSSAFFMR